MAIAFTRNDRPTIGVEMELHLIDAATGDLVSASNQILAALGAGHPHDGKPSRRPVRDLVRELVDQLHPTAEVLDIVEHGSGTARQRRVVERGGTLRDVVHHLADELAADRALTT